jgi:MFS family permease
MTSAADLPSPRSTDIDSTYAWLRLVATLALATVGGAGLWSIVVALPPVQTSFAVTRADVSLAYTLTMVGFAAGSVVMGRFADRVGIAATTIGAAMVMALGYVAAGLAPTLFLFTAAQGLLVGLGSAATFGPLIADASLWFERRRGLAIAICASGSYLAGTLWPPVLDRSIAALGWRHTYVLLGLVCLVTMIPLALMLRRSTPQHEETKGAAAAWAVAGLGLSPTQVQGLLVLAGLACCVAMAMPQAHIVAYCSDLGYGVARGAEMLSLMLGFGIVSRIATGWITDRIGGLPTFLLGSALQAVALGLYMTADGLVSLYVISALFGLFQGGIVPSYAVIIRAYFPAREAATRVGLVLMATILGMALGGWMSGAIFDATGSYRLAFANGLAWNLLNTAIAVFLLLCAWRRHVVA